ncbi:TetR/AcrR family transcriptional regulator [Streptomyces canus]|uniref:TetR/AcrR family transcriptional regulator n=1 Tax=Streptomyces canus TaxID=58343 RepID=UPI0036C16944
MSESVQSCTKERFVGSNALCVDVSAHPSSLFGLRGCLRIQYVTDEHQHSASPSLRQSAYEPVLRSHAAVTANGTSRRRGVGRPSQTDSAETRAHIIARAAGCFAENGFANTPISQLAGAAGVTAGTIYHHFASKSGLFEAVAADAGDHLEHSFIRPLLAITDVQPSFDARLQTLVIVTAMSAQSDVTMHRLALGADLEAQHHPEVRAFRDRIASDLQRLYLGICGYSETEILTEEQQETVAFVESLLLGMWHFSIRPAGPERLPAFVQAFGRMLEGELFAE